MFIGTAVYRHPRLYTALNGHLGLEIIGYQPKQLREKKRREKFAKKLQEAFTPTTPAVKEPKVKKSVQREADRAALDADIQTALTAETNLRELVLQIHAGTLPSTAGVFTYPALSWTKPGLKPIKHRIDKLVTQLAKAVTEARLLEQAKILNEKKTGNGDGDGGGGGNDDTGGGGGAIIPFTVPAEPGFQDLQTPAPGYAGNERYSANEGNAPEGGTNWVLYGGIAAAAAAGIWFFTRRKKRRK